ncbi:hypothetical protein [Paraburkholderia kururiensis]|uniref:hypothetical protein n=1 Tax=Paraburkholderia kururiensis TaxID=984307 RepID=UPI000F88E50E|nr:hypothetical protein [Paraburkholderia kururiensis]
MRLIIEARLVDGESDPLEEGDGVLAVIERPDRSVAELGLTLTEGRSLLAKVQTELISKKVQRWLSPDLAGTHHGSGFAMQPDRGRIPIQNKELDERGKGSPPSRAPHRWATSTQIQLTVPGKSPRMHAAQDA